MVYVTGDTHGNFHRFSKENFPDQQAMTKEDIVIILGDFGGVWDNSIEERYWLEWLNKCLFTICYIDGNHENFDRYYHDNEFEIVDFFGGKAHKIRDSIYHLMRGYTFNFEGKKFFCMGGAKSHDISDGILDISDFKTKSAFVKAYNKMMHQNMMFRVNHLSWWKEELPSQEEMDFGEQILLSMNYKVDYVLSHCLPQSVASVAGYYDSNDLTIYFDKLLQNGLKFDSWWCGHYHRNDRIMSQFNILYKDIVRLI